MDSSDKTDGVGITMTKWPRSNEIPTNLLDESTQQSEWPRKCDQYMPRRYSGSMAMHMIVYPLQARWLGPRHSLKHISQYRGNCYFYIINSQSEQNAVREYSTAYSVRC
jgi:hypothetical protein